MLLTISDRRKDDTFLRSRSSLMLSANSLGIVKPCDNWRRLRCSRTERPRFFRSFVRRAFSPLAVPLSSEAHTPPALYRTSAESFSIEVDEVERLTAGLLVVRGKTFEEAFGRFGNVGTEVFVAEDRAREEVDFLRDLIAANFLGFT